MNAFDRAWLGARTEWRTHAVGILTSCVAFICLGFALLVVFNLKKIEARWQSVGQLSAYLVPGATSKQTNEVVQALRGSRGVLSVRHISRSAARDELLEGTSTPLLQALPETAFPASIEIELEPALALSRVTELVNMLRQLPIVESVETYANWTARVSQFVSAAVVVALALTLVVFLAVVTVVSSTTKLMLERRREEVEVMRIVGATSGYVRGPFLLEGAAQGAFGALAALISCGLVFMFSVNRFDSELALLLGTEPTFLSLPSCASLIAIGGVLGAVAAYSSLRKAFTA